MGAGDAGAQVLSDILRHPGARSPGRRDRRRRSANVGRALHGVDACSGAAPRSPSSSRQARRRSGAAGDPERDERADPRGRRARARRPSVSLRVLPSVREIVGGACHRARPARPADRGPARAPAGRDGPRGRAAAPARQARADHRGRRLDRLRDRAPGPRLRAGEPRAPGQRRDPPARPAGDARRRARRHRSSPTSATASGCSRCSASTGRRSCSTPPPTSTCRSWRTTRRRRSTRTSSARRTWWRPRPLVDTERFVLDLDRQGRAADERDGRLQADRRGDRARARRARDDPAAPSASATCSAAAARVVPTFLEPDRRGRTGDGDRSGDDALLHERPGGGPARPAGRRARARAARCSRSRWGSRSNILDLAEQADPALRTRPGARHRRAGDRRSPGREAARGARRRRRGAGAHRAPGDRRGDAAAPDPAVLRRRLREMETLAREGRRAELRRPSAGHGAPSASRVPVGAEEAS